jgi:undecaprenyl diphosphate synthase
MIGRRDRLPASVRSAVEAAEAATAKGQGLHARLALDYSARDAILSAAARLNRAPDASQASFSRLLAEATHPGGTVPDVDLLIRTGGEQRLSDFLLWESAYAELLFSPRMWPEFNEADLRHAVKEYHGRERRFGRLPPSCRREDERAAL